MASHWSSCLYTILTTTILVREADKLTLMAPHAVETSYEGQVANEWQIPILLKIKSLLLDESCLTFILIHFHPHKTGV